MLLVYGVRGAHNVSNIDAARPAGTQLLWHGMTSSEPNPSSSSLTTLFIYTYVQTLAGATGAKTFTNGLVASQSWSAVVMGMQP